MPTFVYQGTDARGEKRRGEIEAGSRAEALRRLAGDRIQPLRLESKADGSEAPARAADSLPKQGPRLTHAQLVLFTDELADLLHSGLQLEPALHLMENRDERSPVKEVAIVLRRKVRDGVSFSEALRQGSPSFDELYRNLVAAGEVSGALDALLRRQAIHLAAAQELRNRIQLALIYPAVLVVAGALAVVFFMLFLVPQMTALFAKTGSVMPLPTYLLVHFSHFLHRFGWLILLLLAAAGAFFAGLIRREAGRRWWDRAKPRLPLVGPLLEGTFHAQLCQTLANLLQNGLPLLESLKLTSRTTGNVFHRALVVRVTELVGEGASLSRAMKAVGHFPASLRDLVKVGEQTGELGETLEKVGQRCEKIIQRHIDRLMALVPLLIISALGGMVGLIAWSMMSGIFQAVHGLQSHH
jgi:type II secretory pathway component PulF